MSKLAHLEWNKVLPWGIKSPLLSAALWTPSFSSILYPPRPSLHSGGKEITFVILNHPHAFPLNSNGWTCRPRGIYGKNEDQLQEMNSITPDGLQMGKTLKLFWVPQDTQDIGIKISLHRQCQLMFFLWRLTLSSGVTAQLLGMTCFSLSLYLRSATLPQFPGLCLCRPSDNFLSFFFRSVSWPQTLDFFQFQFWGNGHIKTSTSVLARNGMEPEIKGANINITTFAFHLSLVSGLENGQEEHNLF